MTGVQTCALPIFGEDNALAVRGTMTYMVNHSLVKLVLFLAAGPTGLEPATSAVTGRRANQLRYGARYRARERATRKA